MKFCCASNAAIKIVKIARKKNQLFLKNIINKIVIIQKKYRFLETKSIFSDSGGSSRHFDYLFTYLDLIIKL